MHLSDYSSRFLDALLVAFPSFAGRVEQGPEDDEGCFTIPFESPSGVRYRVMTESNDRITVGCDDRHAHFGGWVGSPDEEDFENAIGFIKWIVSGKEDGFE